MRDGLRSLAHLLDIAAAQGDRWQRTGGVARVDTSLLDVLHDAAEIDLGAVAQRVDIDLDRVLQEPVHQHRMLGRQLGGPGDVAVQSFLVVDDLHAASAQHVGRAHQHRITDVGGDLLGLLESRCGTKAWGRQSRRHQEIAEDAAVLGAIDGRRAGAHHRHAGVGQTLGQPQRSLPAELNNHPDNARSTATGFGLGVVHLEHILERQRFEVEAISGVVVGGHRLRIAVDHDGLETRLRQRGCRVYAAVVEFDALADAVGPRTQDEYLGALGLRGHLRLGRRVQLIAGVVVRRLGLELGGAGIDGLVHRPDTHPMT
ncbi:Uncharacterised protein [Mycobacteroides abscessus subsp. abscessus]|nr:Uncharacterised protein [Mycobacteroides abscessus subsp. abscessus]